MAYFYLPIILYLQESAFDISYLSFKRYNNLLHFPLMDVALNVKGIFRPQLNVSNLKVSHHLLDSLGRGREESGR